MMRGRPNSDEEELVQNVARQARDMGRSIRRSLEALTPPPLRSSPSQPSHDSSPASPLALRLGQSRLSPYRSCIIPPSNPEDCQAVALHDKWPCNICGHQPPSRSQENTPVSPTMSTNASPATKGRKSTVSNDADSIMPLLFATIGNPSISFPKMAAMDDEGRTASSLEHKFRKWRQQGREIADKHPEHAAAAPTNATKKPRAPAVKKEASGKGKGKQAGVGDEEDEVDEEAGTAVVKQEITETGAEGEISPKTVKGNSKAKKATPTNGNAVNGSKKRGSEDATADADNEGTPAKKSKVTKKGTAKVQKKAAVKAREEKVTDEEGGSGEEKVAKPKPKSRAKADAKSKSVAQKEQEPEVPAVEDTVGENHFEEAFDPELVGGQEDGMTEMKFEEEV